MYEIIQMFFLAFIIGLTGALAPGPTLVATINSSLSGDWTTGPKVTFGHMIAEFAIFLLIFFGLVTIALPYMTVIAKIGGVALIVFGALTIAGSKKATMHNSPTNAVANPYMAGLVTSLANPYFWIWWLSIGSAMMIAGLQGGLVLAGVFMVGHWCADLGWYTFVSTGVSRGKTILSDTTYRILMVVCGSFLILFGVYYMTRLLV